MQIFSPNPLTCSRKLSIARNPWQHLVRFLSRTSPHKFFFFRNLPSRFFKTKYFTVEPCLQRVENKGFAPNTPGGEWGDLQERTLWAANVVTSCQVQSGTRTAISRSHRTQVDAPNKAATLKKSKIGYGYSGFALKPGSFKGL